MVKTLIGTFLLLLIAVPALAQDDFPRIEMGFGYSNIGLPGATGNTEHHSGFAQQTGLNITRWFGIENYFGYYSLGNSAQMIANTFGGKLMYRTDKAVPYAVAELGGGSITQQGYSIGGTMFATRLGVGVDIPINELLSWKVDVSKLQLRSGGEWFGKANFTTGILLKLGF